MCQGTNENGRLSGDVSQTSARFSDSLEINSGVQGKALRQVYVVSIAQSAVTSFVDFDIHLQGRAAVSSTGSQSPLHVPPLRMVQPHRAL